MPQRPTYHVLGVPLRSGSLYPGSENDTQAYRDVDVVARLLRAGCAAIDEGDVAIPSYLPHHAVPPIRSWPGPRIAWECVAERIAPHLERPGHVPLLLGCDCSVVAGTSAALQRVASDDVHVLYVDGDFDDAAPDPTRCQSAAAVAVWLLTRGGPFRPRPLRPAQVTVVGWSQPSAAPDAGVRSLSLAEVRRAGAGEAARRALAAIPASAAVVLHLDIDVFRRADVPAAYFPHEEGLRLDEGLELLDGLLDDPRVRVIEVAEYAALRDRDHRSVQTLVDLLAESLAP